MSTWRSKKVEAIVDNQIDYTTSEFRWEYGTVADVFTFFEKGIMPGYGTPDKPYEHKESFFKDRAFILFQALANWIRVYEGEDKLKRLLENNPFDHKEQK